MEEKDTIFRKESLARINSPDQLNQYIKISSPSVWCILAGVLILLAGICVWGVFGHLDTEITAPIVICDGKAVIYVKDSLRSEINIGMEIRVSEQNGRIQSVDKNTLPAASIDEYVRYLGGFQEEDWVNAYEITLMDELVDGIYEGKILIDQVTPMSFIWNE